MLESEVQKQFIDWVYNAFPEAIVMKNDASYLLGVPDLTIIVRSRWAFIETKKCSNSHKQPLQEDYIQYADTWAFGAFVDKDNAYRVFNELVDYLSDQ